MKKISIIIAAALCLGAAVSCEDEREIITLNENPTTFVLNTPALAQAEYDLDNSSVVVLTCSQPDFGFTAPTLYTVQVSLENDFETEDKYKTFSTKVEDAQGVHDLYLCFSNVENETRLDYWKFQK